MKSRLRPASRALLLLVPLAFACKSSNRMTTYEAPVPTPTEPVASSPDVVATPEWVTEPLSWEKLAAIEAWLATQPDDGDAFWRVEGELQLAQGRLEFARRAQIGASTPKEAEPAAVASRIRSARAGLQRVARDSAASEGQKRRANELVERADRLLGDAKQTVSASSTLANLSIVSRAVWGASRARTERMERTRGGYTRITVHHSAEEHAQELDGSIADTASALRLMQRSHMESKSPRWGDIGYHFLVDPAGHIFQGRELTWQGAHADAENNVKNVGVCLIGNFDEEEPSRAALASLRKLLDALRQQYSIPKSAVLGHQDLKSTRCPGRHLAPWVKSYAR
jgi:hypothetical protein